MPAIDAKGRCCGRKPIHYKRGLTTTLNRPQLFCCRCDAAYNPDTKEQLENWAYAKDAAGQFVRRYPIAKASQTSHRDTK